MTSVSRIFSWSSLLLVIAIFFGPGFAAASGVSVFQDKIVANSDSAVYRLRSSSKPWQLVSLPNNATDVVGQAVFNDRVFLVTKESGSYQVLSSNDGLSYGPTSIVSPTALGLKVVGQKLWVFQRDLQWGQIWVGQNGSDFAPVSNKFVQSFSGDNIFESNDTTYYLDQESDGKAVIYDWTDQFLSFTTLLCSQAKVLTAPVAAVSCQDGSLYLGDSFLASTEHFKLISSSQELLAGVTDKNQLGIFRNNNFDISDLNGLDASSIIVTNSKIFIHDAQKNWLSVDPKNCCSLSALNITGIDNIQEFNGTFLASQSGTKNSYLSTDGVGFSKINNPSSGNIELVVGNDHGFWLWTKTTAYHYLYLLDKNALSWDRVSLPTKPTFSTSIGDLRNLIAAEEIKSGDFVEITGVISVKRDIVGKGILYVQDNTGGIQVYLSSSKGLLPEGSGQAVIVTGSIGSGQVRKINLEQAGDLTLLGTSGTLTLPTGDIATGKGKLGQVAIIGGASSSLDADSFTLSDQLDSLKIHFDDASKLLKLAISVTLPVVIDWNSSSSQIEAWYLGDGLEAVFKSPTTAASKSSSKKTSTQATTASATVSSTSSQVASAVKSASSSSSKQATPIDSRSFYSVGSLITGLLLGRGRRFKGLFNA